MTSQFGMHYSSPSSSTINIHRASRGRRLTKETTKNMENIYSPSSRSMSRRLALTLGLLLALLLSLPSHAQDGRSKVPINRTISGFTLGVTTPAEARAIIQRQGGKIILEVGVQAGSKDASYIVSGLNYARRPTQTVAMFFYKGHLHSIDFIFDGWDVLEQIESELEETIAQARLFVASTFHLQTSGDLG